MRWSAPMVVASTVVVFASGILLLASPGAGGRWITVIGALVAGGVLAVALIPQFVPWTAHSVFLHPHDRG